MNRLGIIFIASIVLFFTLLVGQSFAITTGYPVAQPIRGGIVTAYPMPTGGFGRSVAPSGMPCIKRPACLDAHPSCMIAEPAGGWCNTTPTPFPTPIHCGGFIKNAPICPTGYACKLGKIPDTGGICIPDITQIPPGIPVAVAASSPAPMPLINLLNGVKGFFTHIFFFWRR